jgi:hypothetical protein
MSMVRLSADYVGADDQANAEYEKQDSGDHHVFGGGFIVLFRAHVLVPLRDLIK